MACLWHESLLLFFIACGVFIADSIFSFLYIAYCMHLAFLFLYFMWLVSYRSLILLFLLFMWLWTCWNSYNADVFILLFFHLEISCFWCFYIAYGLHLVNTFSCCFQILCHSQLAKSCICCFHIKWKMGFEYFLSNQRLHQTQSHLWAQISLDSIYFAKNSEKYYLMFC